MLKKLFTYMMLLMVLTACSVDDMEAPSGLGADGELTVNLAVPEMETVQTRAEEFKLSDITMLVLSSAGVEDVQKFAISDPEFNESSTNLYQLKCKLTPALRKLDGLKFYFIANIPESVKREDLMGKSDSQLKSQVLTVDYTDANSNLTMAGQISLADIRGNKQVSLARNVAKVKVTDGVKNAQGNWQAGPRAYPLEVYGTAKKSSVVAGAISGTEYIGEAISESSAAFTGKSAEYVHRTLNPGRDNAKRPFMVVKAPYQGKEYFYRLEFENFNSVTKEVNKLDILSNHYYEVIIEEILGKGDDTAAAALTNPTSLVKTTIYDHCPESYNMISDGTRELGVSARLSHNGNPTTATTPEYLYIKLFSIDSKEMENPVIDVKSSSAWLSIGSPALYTGADGNPVPGVTGDFKGKVYRVPVQFLKTLDPGELNGTIVVTWKGLQREVPVMWTREFDVSEICTVELKIYDSANNEKYKTGYAKGNDYWAFIRNENLINGLSLEQNNGKVRNEGLHFPVNYGGQGARWRYEYKVKFNNLNDGNRYDWKVSHQGISGISVSPTSGKNVSGSAEFTVTQDGSIANWNYEVGTLKFEISKPEENNWTAYEIDLYHTGFFDNPVKFRNENRRVDTPEKDYFYYYEVIQGPEGSYYWLDRNLGATSAEYYIEADGDNVYFGRNSEPRGGYYKAAAYEKGGEPMMYADLCPPGFEIPRTDVWNTLRNSSNFLTNRSGTYYLTQFTNAKGQTVYFPRAQYYNASNYKTGESRTGYYWTQTAAVGLEKDQIGNWLRYIKFSGSIASYDNAEVEGRNGSAGWAMSVRCVNETTAGTRMWRTHFNVSGATHVFLYSETPTGETDSQGNPIMMRNGVTNWPGTSIGNYSTMGNAAGTASGTNLFNFVYESPNTNPTEFYVIFTFRDKDGIWHTMSKGEGANQTLYTTQTRMSALKGWKVIGDTWNGKTTALGGTWNCNFNGTTATVTYGSPTYEPPVVEELTVIYTNPANWSKVFVYAWTGNDKNNAWPGVEMTKENGDNHRWVGKINKKYKNIIFSNGSGLQTKDLTVVEENNHVYSDNQK